jgi:hypothetical protein
MTASQSNFCSDVGVLKKQCALEIFPAVQAGAQNEMALKQSPGFAEKREQILTHILGSARRWRAVFGGVPKTLASRVIHMAIKEQTPVLDSATEPFDEPSNGAHQQRALPRSGCAR